MPLQPVPESPKQSSAPYMPPNLSGQRSRMTLAPFLSQAGNGYSLLQPKTAPYGGTTRPGVVPPGQGIPQHTPQDMAQQCPPGCVSAEGCAAVAGGAGWTGLIIGAVVSGAAGALGGYMLARWLK